MPRATLPQHPAIQQQKDELAIERLRQGAERIAIDREKMAMDRQNAAKKAMADELNQLKKTTDFAKAILDLRNRINAEHSLPMLIEELSELNHADPDFNSKLLQLEADYWEAAGTDVGKAAIKSKEASAVRIQQKYQEIEARVGAGTLRKRSNYDANGNFIGIDMMTVRQDEVNAAAALARSMQGTGVKATVSAPGLGTFTTEPEPDIQMTGIEAKPENMQFIKGVASKAASDFDKFLKSDLKTVPAEMQGLIGKAQVQTPETQAMMRSMYVTKMQKQAAQTLAAKKEDKVPVATKDKMLRTVIGELNKTIDEADTKTLTPAEQVDHDKAVELKKQYQKQHQDLIDSVLNEKKPVTPATQSAPQPAQPRIKSIRKSLGLPSDPPRPSIAAPETAPVAPIVPDVALDTTVDDEDEKLKVGSAALAY